MKNTDTLKKNYEFKNVLTKGKCYFGKYISIYIIKNNNKTNKIGIAVGKKVTIAVKRNQIKRWIRESYKSYERCLKSNVIIVFVLKKGINVDDLSYWKIKNDIEELYMKAGII